MKNLLFIISVFISSVSTSIYCLDTVCEILGFVLLSPEANLEPHQTFKIEHFYENSDFYIRKKAPS